MEELTIRTAGREDLSDICRVWESCFGDAPEKVACLLETEMLENTVVAVLPGHARALMTAFDGLYLGGVRAAYILALCTEPGFRGRGLGGLVLRETARRAFERGAELVCLHPASESLARWYGRLGFERLSRVMCEPAAEGVKGTLRLERVSAEEYGQLRGDAFGRVPAGLLRAQELFYSGEDGGFFALEGGCVCVQRTENGAEMRELLCPEGQAGAAAAAVSERFGARACTVRALPAESERGSTHLMGLWKDGARREPDGAPYLPFVMD